MHGDLIELREPDLRFIPPEVVHFFNYTMHLGLSPHEISALDKRTEGWIAGLQMVAISLQQHQQSLGEDGVSSFIQTFTGSHRFVMDYLVEEVLNQQPADIQDFLSKPPSYRG